MSASQIYAVLRKLTLKADITLHLTEHHGDGCPGSKVRVITVDVVGHHEQLAEMQYKYNRPGLKEGWTGTPCMTVLDPFRNQLTFVEEKK